MITRVLVWGAGGHAVVVADAARAAGMVVVGFVSDQPHLVNAEVSGDLARVVVSDSDLRSILVSGHVLPEHADSVILGMGSNAVRVGAAALVPHGMLRSVVHPRSVIAASATIEAGTVILANAVVNARASIGRACIINTSAVVEHDCSIGEGVHMSPGAIVTGGCAVHARAWIGAGAVVIPGVVLGADSVVGAGSVVTREVPSGSTVLGVPARQWKPN
jgi:sugar O-acyltransferase (sialic acid O-acetyltransferase NeuD family)